MLISTLLKFEGYPPGIVVSLLLHGILLYIFLPKEADLANQVRIEPASYVTASAVKESPQRKRLRELNTQRQNEERQRERERQQQQQREREQEQERQRQAEAEKQRQAEAEQRRVAEANRQREAEAQRQREAEAQRERDRQAEQRRVAEAQAAADAAARQAAENAARQEALSVENQLVAQYMGIIRDLVSGAWNRPPGARNGMLAIVQLRLTPTGEIISREIVQPSGNAEFDRSVLQAIDRVGSFPELKEMPNAVFERNFRTLNLEFSPEDLLR